MQILLGYACTLEFIGLRPGIYQGQWRLQHRWTGMCPHLAYLSEMPELLCCFRKSTYFPDIPKNGTWPLQRKYKQKIDTHTHIPIYIYIYVCMFLKLSILVVFWVFAHNMLCCVGAFLSTIVIMWGVTSRLLICLLQVLSVSLNTVLWTPDSVLLSNGG